VLSHATNQKLFGGGNSVGKRLQMNDRQFTVVGVMAPWRPFIRMYDPTSNWTGDPEAIYAPFSLTPGMELRTSGNSDNWKSLPPNPTYQDALRSETNFIQYWVELRSPSDAPRYQRFLDDYVRGEKKSGRFPRPLNNVLTSMNETLADLGLVTPQRTAMAAISVLFLLVCALNLTGLVLGKFLARAPEVSVRRALGATRVDIFLQHIVECELVGIVGGAIGVVMSIGVLRWIAKMQATTARMSPDFEMFAAAIFLSLVAGLIAGLYPAWRICNVQPAVQLKV
jgi:putative ABC transport system permease protein